MDVSNFLNVNYPLLLKELPEKRELMCLNFPEMMEAVSELPSWDFKVNPYEIEVSPENEGEFYLSRILKIDTPFKAFEFSYQGKNFWAVLHDDEWFFLREKDGFKEIWNDGEYQSFPEFADVIELISLLPWKWKE